VQCLVQLLAQCCQLCVMAAACWCWVQLVAATLFVQMRAKLEAAGGKVYENVQLAGVEVCSDGVALALNSQAAAGDGSAGGGGATPGLPSGPHVQYATTITGRLVLDCMGHASPIVKQLR